MNAKLDSVQTPDFDAPVPDDRARGSHDPALQMRVRGLMERRGLSQAQAANETGVSPTALSQWLQGKYAGSIPAIEGKLANWLAAQERHDAAAGILPNRPDFFRSPTAEKALAVFSYAQMMGDIVCVYGHPGVGKTRSIHQYRSTNPSVWVATISPNSASLGATLEEVGDALGVRESGRRKLARAIRRRMEGTRGLLIIDEAQNLSIGALEELRSIHDATDVGLALVGNPDVYARLTGGERSMRFAQLYSRIGMRLFLKGATAGDVRALAAAWGVKGSEEIALLREVAAEPGALRAASKVLVLAAMAGGGEGLTLETLRQARGNLGAKE
ncbi:AAA family ATPase [Neomegalonema sp.]|uniref:AAA family ATPase n=1 Tax=Neomegalonema sp. TaxID=2039713 RepID=UPI00261AFCD3|nr:AAA family ATPase [Neomegalonema sp.]MDD2870112.1 AAA family ATPase [Neomegalonema sp.]